MSWFSKQTAEAARMVDETLAHLRHVHKSRPDGDGYLVRLSCGHDVWMAVPPGPQHYCGECLSMLADQARVIARSQQKP